MPRQRDDPSQHQRNRESLLNAEGYQTVDSKAEMDTLLGALAKWLYLYEKRLDGKKIVSIQVFHKGLEYTLILTFDDATSTSAVVDIQI